ncbi:hypothetical protein F66182_13507 [Fusarium sp. NRRL 66182]|nr:hypothetical protein F66182_13507 [Fusarium sp. NRRL 66182]
MKAKALLGLLVSYIAVGPSLAAVTWKTVGCEQVTHNGVNIDDMWDNALLMAQNAQTSINSITSGITLPRTTKGRVADNARSMFGIDINWVLSLGSAAKSTLSDVLGE